MLRLKTRLNLRSILVLKCEKHRTYNPENGPGAIRGACERCATLYMVYNTQRKLINALCDFEQVSKPFETVKMRAPKKPTGTSPELEKAFQTLLPKVKPDLEATRARNMEGYRTLRGEKKVVEGSDKTGYQDGDYGALADFILHGNRK